MRLLLILVLAFAATWADISETGLLTTPTLQREGRGNPAFTDSTLYNEWYMCGSPLGLLEAENVDLKLSLGYKYYHESGTDSVAQSRTAHSLQVPDILIGKKETVYFGLSYDPSFLTEQTGDLKNTISPLHRFGLLLATQTGSKHFRFGIRGQGFIGTQKDNLGQDKTRAAMGVNALSMYLGSEVHPLVRIGLHGGVTAAIDSLRDLEAHTEDRFFYGSIPTYGGDVSVGGSSIPVRSILSVDIAKNHFVYVVKPSDKENGNEDAIVGDSVYVKWNSSGDIPAASAVIQPALSLAYSYSGVKTRAPGAKNYPLSYGAFRSDTNWTISCFTLGLGSNFKFANYGNCFIEYGHDFFGLSYHREDSLAKWNRGFDRIALGLECNIHAIPTLNIPSSTEIFLRLGYMHTVTTRRFGMYYRDEFREFTPMYSGALLNGTDSPYEPQSGGIMRISRFTLGTGATFLDKTLGIDLLLGIGSLKQADQALSATELAARAFYAIPGK